jgi:hypothetical protein
MFPGLELFIQQHPLLALVVCVIQSLLLAVRSIYGNLDRVERATVRVVTFAHRMQLQWRRLRAGPHSRIVHN